MSKLWESDHPYYASEGCFYRTGHHENIGSWTEFMDSEWHINDPDLNLLYRWDWDECDPDDGDEERAPLLKLYYVMQRKAYTFSVHVTVSRDDEPEIREWLMLRRLKINEIWSPL